MQDTRNRMLERYRAYEGIPWQQAASLAWQEKHARKKKTAGHPTRAFVVSDIHTPYQDDDALEIALGYARRQKIDIVLLNGDILDCYKLSYFRTDPNRMPFQEEVKRGRAFLRRIARMFPNAVLIYQVGNHERRNQSYLDSNAPHYAGMKGTRLVDLLDLSSRWRLVDANLDLCRGLQVYSLGRLKAIHGDETKVMSSAVSPAKTLLDRTRVSVIAGHVHRADFSLYRPMGGELVAAWTTGCLCKLSESYMPINNWCHGFAVVEVDDDGDFDVQNKIIVRGKVRSA